MKPYEYFNHTADAKFRAYGKTLEEAFSNAAKACFNIIKDPLIIKPKLEFPIELRVDKKEKLLFDFIDELLFLLDTEGFLLHEIENLEIKETKEDEKTTNYVLTALATGDNLKNYDELGCNVKSMTYNELEIGNLEDDSFYVQVVVDL